MGFDLSSIGLSKLLEEDNDSNVQTQESELIE